MKNNIEYSIEFINLNTVICDFMGNVSAKNFFVNINDMINKGNITNFKRDFLKNRYVFDYGNNVYFISLSYEYVKTYNEIFEHFIQKCNSIQIIFSLVDEYNIRYKNEEIFKLLMIKYESLFETKCLSLSNNNDHMPVNIKSNKLDDDLDGLPAELWCFPDGERPKYTSDLSDDDDLGLPGYLFMRK